MAQISIYKNGGRNVPWGGSVNEDPENKSNLNSIVEWWLAEMSVILGLAMS